HGPATAHQSRGPAHRNYLAPRLGFGRRLRRPHHRLARRPDRPRWTARRHDFLCGPDDLWRDKRRMTSAGRWAGGLAMVAALVWSSWSTDVSLRRLIEGAPFMLDFIRRMLPPDPSVLGQALHGALQTVQIALVGTSAAAVLAVPLALAAARNTAPR